MQTISNFNCRLNTKNATWAIDLIFDDKSGAHSFELNDPDAVETFLEVFEDATACHFDAEKQEVVFAFEYLDGEDEEDSEETSESDDDTTSEADSDDEDDEDQPGSGMKKAG
jgi:hypothetical protein